MLLKLKWFATILMVASFAVQPGFSQQAGPASWEGDLTPIGPPDWNYDFAAHLIERAGFGATPSEIDVLAGALREHAGTLLEDRYLPPAVRALLASGG